MRNIHLTFNWHYKAAPYPVRPARQWPYLDFEKEKAAAAARRHYRVLTWLGRARRAGGAPDIQKTSKKNQNAVRNTVF